MRHLRRVAITTSLLTVPFLIAAFQPSSLAATPISSDVSENASHQDPANAGASDGRRPTHGFDKASDIRQGRPVADAPPARDYSEEPAPNESYPEAPSATGGSNGSTPTNYTSTSIRCANDLQHFTAIYARPRDQADRYGTIASNLRQQIYNLSGYLDDEAGTSVQKLYMHCPAGSTALDVANIVLPTASSSTTFDTITQDLAAMGINSAREKYIVFADTPSPSACNGCAGQGTFFRDDRLSTSNANNVSTGYAVEYRWNATPHWDILLHEVLHTMGGVQDSAPHSTGAAHCYEGADIMCYDDKGPKAYLFQYHANDCARLSGYGRIDCFRSNPDGGDYFAPFPASGAYLTKFWNVAAHANAFMYHSP